MSGGSHDYLYLKIEDMASRLEDDQRAERRAFAVLLRKVAKAAHDVEWVDSCDMAKGQEVPAIMEALGGPEDPSATAAVLATVTSWAEGTMAELGRVLADARKVGRALGRRPKRNLSPRNPDA